MMGGRRFFYPDWVIAKGKSFCRRWRRGVEVDDLITAHKEKSFLLQLKNEGLPNYLSAFAIPKRRGRGWWAKFAVCLNNPFGISEEDQADIERAKAACARLTDTARRMGAQANKAKAVKVQEALIRGYGSEISALPARGVSRLAKQLAPRFGLSESTMRRHITVARKLISSR